MVRLRLALALGMVTTGAVALVTACSSFSGEEPAEPSPASEAGAGDGAIAFDGGGSPPDAGAEAGEGFCASVASNPLLCADFDQGAPVKSGFEIQVGTVSVDGTHARSAPGSLLAVAAPGDSYLQRSFPEKPDATSVRVSFAVRLDEGAEANSPLLVPVRLLHDESPSACTFALAIRGGDVQLTVQALSDAGLVVKNYPLLESVPFGSWASVAIRLDAKPAGVEAKIEIDGAPALTAATVCPAFGGPTRLQLGMLYGVEHRAHFDDVLFDRR